MKCALHARDEKVAILSADRTEEVTAEAAAKAADSQGHLETVFSATALPVDFFRDMVRGHSAKALLLAFFYIYVLVAWVVWV